MHRMLIALICLLIFQGNLYAYEKIHTNTVAGKLEIKRIDDTSENWIMLNGKLLHKIRGKYVFLEKEYILKNSTILLLGSTDGGSGTFPIYYVCHIFKNKEAFVSKSMFSVDWTFNPSIDTNHKLTIDLGYDSGLKKYAIYKDSILTIIKVKEDRLQADEDDCNYLYNKLYVNFIEPPSCTDDPFYWGWAGRTLNAMENDPRLNLKPLISMAVQACKKKKAIGYSEFKKIICDAKKDVSAEKQHKTPSKEIKAFERKKVTKQIKSNGPNLEFKKGKATAILKWWDDVTLVTPKRKKHWDDEQKRALRDLIDTIVLKEKSLLDKSIYDDSPDSLMKFGMEINRILPFRNEWGCWLELLDNDKYRVLYKNPTIDQSIDVFSDYGDSFDTYHKRENLLNEINQKISEISNSKNLSPTGKLSKEELRHLYIPGKKEQLLSYMAYGNQESNIKYIVERGTDEKTVGQLLGYDLFERDSKIADLPSDQVLIYKYYDVDRRKKLIQAISMLFKRDNQGNLLGSRQLAYTAFKHWNVTEGTITHLLSESNIPKMNEYAETLNGIDKFGRFISGALTHPDSGNVVQKIYNNEPFPLSIEKQLLKRAGRTIYYTKEQPIKVFPGMDFRIRKIGEPVGANVIYSYPYALENYFFYTQAKDDITAFIIAVDTKTGEIRELPFTDDVKRLRTSPLVYPKNNIGTITEIKANLIQPASSEQLRDKYIEIKLPEGLPVLKDGQAGLLVGEIGILCIKPRHFPIAKAIGEKGILPIFSIKELNSYIISPPGSDLNQGNLQITFNAMNTETRINIIGDSVVFGHGFTREQPGIILYSRNFRNVYIEAKKRNAYQIIFEPEGVKYIYSEEEAVPTETISVPIPQ